MANSNSVKFVDNSDPAKNGLMEQQKLALRAVAKMLRKRVRDAAPVKTGTLKKNIGTWVKTNRKTGESVLLIGTYNAAAAKKKNIRHAFYASILELGGKGKTARPFLKNTIMASVSDIRAEEAKFLPDIKPVYNASDEDEEIED